MESAIHLLDTAEMSLEHIGINLADELRDSLARWDLKNDNLVSITNDNVRNIVCAVEIPCFGCLAHTLQIGVLKSYGNPTTIKSSCSCMLCSDPFSSLF